MLYLGNAFSAIQLCAVFYSLHVHSLIYWFVPGLGYLCCIAVPS